MNKYLVLVVNVISLLLLTNITVAAEDIAQPFQATASPKFPSCPTLNINSDSKAIESLTTPATDLAVLQADDIHGIMNGDHYAKGNVMGDFAGDTITANWLSYNQESKHVQAGDNVVLTRQYDIITGKWVNYYFSLNKGEILDATAYEQKSRLYARGAKIKIFNKNHYQVQRGFFTSCNPNNPDWHIEVNKVDLNYQNNQGNARSAVFYAKKIPIGYLPYFPFPLGRRQSGILTPSLGFLDSGGFFFGVPYYWNIAPNYDLTFTPYVYSSLGLLFKGDFRYLQHSGSGSIYTEQLPGFNSNKYKYYWHLKDDRSVDDNKIKFGYDYNKVSDGNYFNNLGDFTTATSSVNLSQRAYAKYSQFWGDMAITMQGYQVLTIPGVADSPVYTLLPQLSLNIKPLKVLHSPVIFSADTSYSNFYNDSLQSGKRLVIYPSLNLPLNSSWGFINPKFGYNYSNYQLDAFKTSKAKQINRLVPITSIDSGLFFDRKIKLFGNGYEQTLEPRLFYLYIPPVDQSNILIFDTALNTPSLNNLFSENRFSGSDRINAANDITVGLSSQLIDTHTGSTYADWGLGYRIKLAPENLNNYGSAKDYPLFQQNINPNLIAQINNHWSNNFSTFADYQYSTTGATGVNLYALQMQYKTPRDAIFNIRYSYQAKMPLIYYNWVPGQSYNHSQFEDQRAIDISTRIPVINNKIFFEGRANYDMTTGKSINFISGLQYLSDCWSVNFVYENYRIGPSQTQNAYYLQFNLNGLTSIGTDANAELIKNIPGYVPITKIN